MLVIPGITIPANEKKRNVQQTDAIPERALLLCVLTNALSNAAVMTVAILFA